MDNEKQLVEDLNSFVESGKQLLENWKKHTNEGDLLLNAKYPFVKSFDEVILELKNWREDVNNFHKS